MTDGNDSAFASEINGLEVVGGCSKRELFAAMAMQGNLASEAPNFTSTVEIHAQMAVKSADALIEALNK